jgi:hypothetical protein
MLIGSRLVQTRLVRESDSFRATAIAAAGGTQTTIRSARSKGDSAPDADAYVSPPAGTVTGDVVIVLVACSNSTTITDNNGAAPFTESATKNQTTTGQRISVFERRLTGAESGDYHFTLGVVSRWAVVAITFQDPHPSVIWDSPATLADGLTESAASTTTMDTFNFSTSNNNAIHIIAVAPDLGDNFIDESGPSGNSYITQGTEIEPDQAFIAMAKTFPTAGAVPAQTFSWLFSTSALAVSVAVRSQA